MNSTGVNMVNGIIIDKYTEVRYLKRKKYRMFYQKNNHTGLSRLMMENCDLCATSKGE